MIRVAILSQVLGDRSADPAYVEPILRVAGPLLSRGVEIVHDDPDVVLVDVDRLESVDTSLPLVLFDRSDGGMLGWYGTGRTDLARRWLRSPRVGGVVKITRYTGVDFYNTPWTGGGYHLHLIHEASPQAFPRPEPYSVGAIRERDLTKVELAYGFWAFRHCDGLAAEPPDLFTPRRLEVLCGGTLRYESPLVTHHRHLALEQVGRLRTTRVVTGRGRVLPHDVYCDLLRSTRVCVSPWGWGETCIRDYEAMLAGCVVIKPRTDFIESWPPVEERHYVPCAVDFSDLSEKVEQVLAQWDDYTEMRRQNRERLLALRRPDVIADRLAEIVRRCLERAA
jgi:hypothetical protein